MLTLLCNCSKSAPNAYVIKAGMTCEEVVEALKAIDIEVETETMEDDEETSRSPEIRIEQDLDYLGVKWESCEVSFNKQGLVDQVAFYLSDGNINKTELIDKISKELGKPSAEGTLTTWSVEDKWLVSFADNDSPYPKCLVYWYQEYMDSDNSNKEDTDLEQD